ncbi:MAG TPA: hypothetical protein VKF35_21920 [Hyphomicrobiaceae bacterium]|nr:hypothetical protein [Hyphomicrobiaceae bacterium]
MLRGVLRTMWLSGLLLALVHATAGAQDKPVRVRGTIERVDGNVYVVKSRSGGEQKIKLVDNAPVVAVVKSALADVKPGSYVGIASMPQPDGGQKALEVLIFPETMRGVGEGHYGWDLQPSSMMTNGNVDQTVAAVDGQVLTVKYKDGEKKIVVPPDTPIVSFVPGEKDELKPGAAIFIAGAKPQADGTLEAARIAVGRGTTPPM